MISNTQTLVYLRELCDEGYPYGSIVKTAEKDISFLDSVSGQCNCKEDVAKYFYED